MKRDRGLALALYVAGGFLCSHVAEGQRSPIGNWSAPGNDAGHSGWQRNETSLSSETTSSQFKFLWKLKLGGQAKDATTFSEPLLALRLINAQGFKDIVFTSTTDTLYAVDSELGSLLWKKQYEVGSRPSGACARSNLGIVMDQPVVINFAARRTPGAALGAPPPPPPKAEGRRVGAAAGGGGFALRGIYVLTPDGNVHEQVLTTGADFAAPVNFIPSSAGGLHPLNIGGKSLYTVTTRGCGSTPNALWSLDMTTSQYPVSSFKTQTLAPIDVMGPTLGDGVAYMVTGGGKSDASAGVYANSVISVTEKGLKVKDWYTPAGSGKATLLNVTPVAFTLREKKLVAAPGKDGSLVLLENASLGGADHHTPLVQTARIASGKHASAGGLAYWQEPGGPAWIFASVSGPVDAATKFTEDNGAANHGSVVAFKVEEKDGKVVLTPSWRSSDLVNPAPPLIANGVLIALSQGDNKTHAKLFALDAKSGKQLFQSGETISTYAHLAGLSFGDGHVFFVTHDNTLYSFGIGLEH